MMLCLQYSQSGWWSSFALLDKRIVNDINLSMVGMCWTDQGENMHIWTLTYQHKSASNLPWTFQHGKNILIGLFWSHIRHSLSNKLFRNIYRMYTIALQAALSRMNAQMSKCESKHLLRSYTQQQIYNVIVVMVVVLRVKMLQWKLGATKLSHCVNIQCKFM